MCTNIAATTRVSGSAKFASGWMPVDEAVVTFDHAERLWTEHALRIDLVGARDRVAVELDLASAQALLARLADVIKQAEAAGV